MNGPVAGGFHRRADMPAQRIEFVVEIRLREATVATGVSYASPRRPSTLRHMGEIPVAEVAAVATQ